MNYNKFYKKKFYKKFSIGYNGKRNFFNEIIIPFRNYISSVYAVPPFSSGISNARWALNVSAKKLLELRMKLKEEKIKFNLIYNFDGIAFPDDSFINKLLLITDFFKPDIVTFSNTFVRDAFIKNTNYKLNISVIHDINTMNQLEMLIENDEDKQITSYNIGRRKTYNLQYIKSIREKYPDLNLKLMVNEGCIFECPDQIFHSCSLTISRGNIQNAGKIFFCGKLKPDQYWRFLAGQYIPPKFLSNYCDLVDEFKIGTRNFETNEIIKVLTEYINEKDITILRAMQSSHGGSLFCHNTSSTILNNAKGILKNDPYSKPYPPDFFKMRSSCKNECCKCNYCKYVLLN